MVYDEGSGLRLGKSLLDEEIVVEKKSLKTTILC